MRPTPGEVIAGVRRILKEVVEPDVSTEYARSRLREVRAVLAQIDWDDHLALLAGENARVALLAVQCRDWIKADSAREAAFGPTLPALSCVNLDDAPEVDPFSTHVERANHYSQLMIEIADRLADWTKDHADDSSELLRRIRGHYARPPRP